MLETKITIVGLGLIGGSFAQAIRPLVREITAVDLNQASLDAALADGTIDHGTTSFAVGVRSAELVVFAAPARTILSLLVELPSIKPTGCMVFDLGSTKQSICQLMEMLPPNFSSLGGHPMCGKEISGYESADSDLFHNATFILCPTSRTSPKLREIVDQLIAQTGANPLEMNPADHDRIVASVSHVPYILSALTTGLASQQAEDDERVWPVSSSGFRDTSRVSGSDPTMMMDILVTNKTAVKSQLYQVIAEMERIIKAMDMGDDNTVRDWLEQTQANYNTYYKAKHSNKK